MKINNDIAPNENVRNIYKLLPKHEIAKLSIYPAWKQFARLSIIILTYFFLFYLSTFGILFITLLSWWFQGFLLVCCLNIIHDCTHRNYIRNAKFCRWFGSIFGAMILVNFSLFRYLHLDHHRFTNMKNDTQRPREYPNLWKYLIAVPHWKFPIRTFSLCWNFLKNKFPPSIRTIKARNEVIQDTYVLFAWIFFVVIMSILYPFTLLKLYWIPILFYFAMVFFVTVAEHSGCDKSADKTCNTRSVFSNFILRFFSGGFNFHAEHHLYPGIPSPQLIHVHKKIGKHVKHIEKSYIAFHFKLVFPLIKKLFTQRKIKTTS